MPLNTDSGQRYLYYDDTYGVSLIDVARCLRDYRKDKNGNYNLSLLCTSPNINPWAKFKPVRRAFIDEEDRMSDWWKAADGMCGFDLTNAKISDTTDVSDIASHYTEGGDNGWDYAAPRGGDSEPFRLADFVGNTKNVGYNHLVEPFVAGYNMPFVWTKDEDEFEVSFRHTITDVEDADYLSHKDFLMENYYLGLALVGESNGKVYRCTNDVTIEGKIEEEIGSSLHLMFPIANVDVGKYIAYPFISEKKMGILDGGFVAGKVYTLPRCAGTAIEIKAKKVTIMIKGVFSDKNVTSGMYSMTYTITIINNAQYDQVFSNNYIQLRYKGKQFTDTLLAEEKQQELNLGKDITVNAGESVQVFGLFTDIIEAIVNNPTIWVSLDSSDIKQEGTPEQEMNPDA